MSDELILNTSRGVSFESSLLAFTNYIPPLLVQLLLETSEYLEKLTFSREWVSYSMAYALRSVGGKD